VARTRTGCSRCPALFGMTSTAVGAPKDEGVDPLRRPRMPALRQRRSACGSSASTVAECRSGFRRTRRIRPRSRARPACIAPPGSAATRRSRHLCRQGRTSTSCSTSSSTRERGGRPGSPGGRAAPASVPEPRTVAVNDASTHSRCRGASSRRRTYISSTDSLRIATLRLRPVPGVASEGSPVRSARSSEPASPWLRGDRRAIPADETDAGRGPTETVSQYHGAADPQAAPYRRVAGAPG
jgi:hypothetical protein